MATTSIKTGTTVQWTSQAAGYKKTKKGTVVTVLKKNTDYTSGNSIPQTLFVDILRTDMGFSRDRARELYTSCDYRALQDILTRRYRVQFRLLEGMERDETHYLIEVLDGSNKPYLYHPRAGETFTIVK